MTNARVMQVATSLNSALANYDNKTVTAEKYYNKTESDNNYPRFPDYSNQITITSTTWTATCDCYFAWINVGASNIPFIINNHEIQVRDSASSYVTVAIGYAKKGDVISCIQLNHSELCKIYPLI